MWNPPESVHVCRGRIRGRQMCELCYIKARIRFKKSSGGIIEIFCLEPYQSDYTATLSSTKACMWKCMIGGAGKWKDGELVRSFELGVKMIADL